MYVTNKEASTVLCSVVKHAGSGRARKKCRGKHETKSSVFPHVLSALPLPKLPLPKCFTTEQSTVEVRKTKVRKTKLLSLVLLRAQKRISEQASVHFAEMTGERALLHCM